MYNPQQQQQYYQQQQKQYQQYYSQQITVKIYKGDDDPIPLIIYRGTSTSTIMDNIRELTNLHRFRCTKDKKGAKTMILSSSMQNNSKIYIHDPTKDDQDTDEPTPTEQAEYFKSKVQQMAEAKNILNVFKTMLISLELSAKNAAIAKDLADNKDDQKGAPADDDKKADGNDNDNKPADDNKDKDDPDPSKSDDNSKPASTDDIPPPPPAADDNPDQKQTNDTVNVSGGDNADVGGNTDQKVDIKDILPDDTKDNKDDDIIDADADIVYDGKYKDLVNEMETRLELLQSIVFAEFDISDELKPKKLPIIDDDDDDDNDKKEEKSDEQKKLEALLQPNMNVQIAQMQQLLQMQQMALMSQLAMTRVGGGAAGGGGGAVPGLNVMASVGLPGTPMVGGLPSFGGGMSLQPISAGGKQPSGLAQSVTTPAVEDEKKADAGGPKSNLKKWFGGSKIIEDDEYNTLIEFFDNKGNDIKEITRIFVASENDYDATKFHKKCDGVLGTLVLAKSAKSHTFGGYTTQSWSDDDKRGTWKTDPDAFIFLLRSMDDQQLPEKWKIADDKQHKAVRGDNKYGPTFGYGYDLRICNKCNTVEDSSSQLDSTDACYNAPKNDELIAGEFYFKVLEYEIYKVVI